MWLTDALGKEIFIPASRLTRSFDDVEVRSQHVKVHLNLLRRLAHTNLSIPEGRKKKGQSAGRALSQKGLKSYQAPSDAMLPISSVRCFPPVPLVLAFRTNLFPLTTLLVRLNADSALSNCLTR